MDFGLWQHMETNIVNKNAWYGYLKYAIVAATLYSIVAYVFFTYDNFENLWMLYIGNSTFGFSVFWYCWRRRVAIASSASKVGGGVLVTLCGIGLSCIIMAALLIGMNHSLINLPANNAVDTRNGLIPIIFVNAVIVNFFCGSFISLLIGFDVQRINKRRNEDIINPPLPSNTPQQNNVNQL